MIRGFLTKKDKLKSSTISELRPYLVRPTHPESVFSRIIEKSSSEEPKQGFNLVPMAYAQEDRPADQTWKFEHTGDRKVKVWSYHSQEHAQSTAELIDSYNMYQKINNLMERETVSDAGEKNEDGTPNNGGDGCLDIYLVPGKSLQMDAGICIPIKDTKITPSWIMINETLGGEELVAT